jgi:hypothetical protein
MLFSSLLSHINTGVNGLSLLRRLLRPRLQTSLFFRALRTIGNNYVLRPGEHLVTQLNTMDKKRIENVDGWKPDSLISWGAFGLPTDATTGHFELLEEPLLVFMFAEQLQELLKLPSLRQATEIFTEDVFSSAFAGTLTVEQLHDLLAKCNKDGIDMTIPKTYKPVEPLLLCSSPSNREPAAEPEDSDPADIDQHGAFGAVGTITTKGLNRGRARNTNGASARDRQRSTSQGRGEPSVNVYASARTLAGPNFENLAALVTSLNAHIKEIHGIDNYFAPRGPGLGPKTPPDSDWASLPSGPKQLRKDFYLLYMFLHDICRSTSSPVKLSAIGQAYRDEKDTSWTGLTKADCTRLFARRKDRAAPATLPTPRDITIHSKDASGASVFTKVKEFSS